MSALRLVAKRGTEKLPLAERGRVLDPSGIAADVFGGHVSRKWVLRNVPHIYRHRIGRLILYYENEVREWMDTQRGAA